MAISPAICIAIWDRALEAEIGIAVPIIPPEARTSVIAHFYEARKASGDPRYDAIAIVQPSNGELWFCKKETRL